MPPKYPSVSPSIGLPVAQAGLFIGVSPTGGDSERSPPAPTHEPSCEKCGGALEQLTRLPKFDHPAFEHVPLAPTLNMRIGSGGRVRWNQQQKKTKGLNYSRSPKRSARSR